MEVLRLLGLTIMAQVSLFVLLLWGVILSFHSTENGLVEEVRLGTMEVLQPMQGRLVAGAAEEVGEAVVNRLVRILKGQMVAMVALVFV